MWAGGFYKFQTRFAAIMQNMVLYRVGKAFLVQNIV